MYLYNFTLIFLKKNTTIKRYWYCCLPVFSKKTYYKQISRRVEM